MSRKGNSPVTEGAVAGGAGGRPVTKGRDAGGAGVTPVPDKEWTMLVYMAGDNNLTDEMVWGLREMEKTLAADPTIDRRVGVAAYYDASGLNPCLLRLNSGSEDDGALDQRKTKTYGWGDVCERVSKKLKPTREQTATAVRHEMSNELETLTKDVAASYGMVPEEAERFITGLMLCDEDSGQRLLKDPATLALAIAQTKTQDVDPPASTLRSARTAARAGHGQFPKFLKELTALEQNPKVEKLADRLAKSSDSVTRNTRDLSSPLMIQDFIEEQIRNATKEGLKAKRYIVVLSGHGGGATGDFLPDEDPPSSLTIPRMAEMLKLACKQLSEHAGSGKIHILGMDSCLMSMAEVGYEVQDSVEYLVGSEGFMANSGWPYHRVVEVLGVGQAPADTAEDLVKKYAAFYQDYEMGGSSTHLAALQLAGIGKVNGDDCLARAVKDLAANLRQVLEDLPEEAEQTERAGMAPASPARTVRDALILAHWYAQSFKFEKYVDLWDFCDQLQRFLAVPKKPAAGDPRPAIHDGCERVKKWVRDAVRLSCYCGPEFQHAHGISVFFPWSAEDLSTDYAKLAFARDTGWFEFLRSYLTKTRRLRRAHNPNAEPRRLGSDVERLFYKAASPYGSKAVWPFWSKAASPYGSKAASPYGSKAASPYGSKAASPYGSKAASPYGSKMQDGKIPGQANLKNPPDGFFRQDCKRKRMFIDAKGKRFYEK